MRKLAILSILALLVVGFNACSTDGSNELVNDNGLSNEVVAQIKALGFSSENAFATDGGVIVEGDIFLSKEDLQGHTHGKLPSLVVGNEEQYHTFNLVTVPAGGRTITVSVSGSVSAGFSTAVNDAIDRYNAENLSLTFQRVTSGGNINIQIVNTGQYIASAGFPSNGDPFPTISYAKKYSNYNNGFMTTVLAHEMGHCIGFRHTDYTNRSYSCGSGGNEGQTTTGVGAVQIPGTPAGPDPNSWMLACLSASTNRPFNGNDVTALNYLY